MFPHFSEEVMLKLNKFSMAQQELALALWEAKPVGICKISTYLDQKLDFKNLDLTLDVGKGTTRTATILTKEELKRSLVIQALRPRVKTKKHYFQVTLSNVTSAATNQETFLDSVETTVANLAHEVAEGATVSAFFAEIWVIGGTADQFFTAVIAKLPGGVPSVFQGDLVDLFSYDNKKNILYTTQGLAPNDGVGQPIPLVRQWFKVPKSKQRFGLGDRLQFAISSRGDGTITYCGFFMYKEQG